MFAASFPPLPPVLADIESLIQRAVATLGREAFDEATEMATDGDGALQQAFEDVNAAMASGAA